MVSNFDARPRDSEQSSTPSTSMAAKAAERLQDEVEAGKRRAETRIDSMAHSMHDAVDLLHDENEQLLARGMDYAAGRLESAARYLKDRSFRDLSNDAADAARAHSLAFLGLALVSGLAVGRFLRSSTHHSQHTSNTSSNQDRSAEWPFAAYRPGTTAPTSEGPPPEVTAANASASSAGSSPASPFQPGGHS